MVLVEPLTIAAKALTQLWQVQQRLPWVSPVMPGQAPGVGHRAVVLGAGPVGLLGAMLLRASGFETYVYSLEPVNSLKGHIVEAIGATYVSGATVLRPTRSCSWGRRAALKTSSLSMATCRLPDATAHSGGASLVMKNGKGTGLIYLKSVPSRDIS